MNTKPRGLKGLTAKDRAKWDYANKGYYVSQGFTEDEIDRVYKNEQFGKAFQNDPNYENLKKLSPEERDEYYNTHIDSKTKDFRTPNMMPQEDRTRIPFAPEPEEEPQREDESLNRFRLNVNPRLGFNEEIQPFDISNPYNQNTINSNKREAELQRYMDEYYDAHPSSGNPIEDWRRYGISLEGKDKAARRYAIQKYNEAHKTEAQKDADEDYVNAYMNAVEAYDSTTPIIARLGNLAIEEFGNITGLGFKSPRERVADQYALYKQAADERENAITPIESNPYRNISSAAELKSITPNLSSFYKEWQNDEWLPDSEIDWDYLYDKYANDLRNGKLDKVRYELDQYFQNDIVDHHQTFWNSRGRMDILSAVGAGLAAGAVESATEGLTAVPSFAVGLWQATFDPSDLQIDQGLNWWQRTVDNTVHNDWLGFASNQSVQDWGDEIMQNRVIYGNDFNSLLGSSAFTFGASAGTAAQMLIGTGEARLINKGLTVSARAAKNAIVRQGLEATQKLFSEGVTSNKLLFTANYAEAVQQGLDDEKNIYEGAEASKQKVLSSYLEEIYNNPQAYPYDREDLENAFADLSPEWQDYFNKINVGQVAVPPQDGTNALDVQLSVQMRARAYHKFKNDVPDYDRDVEAHARNVARVNTQLQTGILFGADRVFGGMDKLLLDFTKAKKLVPKGKNKIGKIALTTLKTQAIETATEAGQQTESALAKQVAENNIENYLNSHLYGSGAATINGVSYAALSDIDKEEFERDAALKETILSTLISVPLMPTLGYRGKVKPRKSPNQSNFSYVLQGLHYVSPVNTILGNEIFNTVARNTALKDYQAVINNWYAKPENQALYRGTAGMADFSIKIAEDIANGDEVKFNDDVFKRTLSEAIMLSQSPESNISKNRLAMLQNMANINKATDAQKQQAIADFREETKGNPEAQKLSDDQILNLLETNGKRVVDLYSRVQDEIQKLNDVYGEENLDWVDVSTHLFSKLAQEDLQKRIESKQSLINDVAGKISNLDLGESKTSVEDADRTGYIASHASSVLLSGHDILKLNPLSRSFILNPANKAKFSKEQQKIIDDTRAAILSEDVNALNAIRQVADETRTVKAISDEYRSFLAKPQRLKEKMAKKAEETIKEVSNRASRKFQRKINNASSPADIRRIINEEVSKGSKSRVDIEKSLNNINNKDVQDKVAEARRIDEASVSIKRAITDSNLSGDLKDSLFDVVDSLAEVATSVDNMYDLESYTRQIVDDGTNDVRQQAQAITDILNKAKTGASNTVRPAPDISTEINPAKGVTPAPAKDLSKKDVDTATPVNNGVATRMTLEELQKEVDECNKIQRELNNTDISPSERYNLEKASLVYKSSVLGYIKALPEGYEVITKKSADGVIEYEIKKTATPKSQQVLDEPEFAEGDEGTIVFGDELVLGNTPEETPTEEPTTETTESYPDNDPRSITKIAVGKYSEDGHPYTFAIRDESVSSGDRAETSYTDKKGQVHTSTTGPLEVISIEEFNKRREANPEEYSLSLEDLATKYGRPEFISQNSRVSKQENSVTNEVNTDITQREAGDVEDGYIIPYTTKTRKHTFTYSISKVIKKDGVTTYNAVYHSDSGNTSKTLTGVPIQDETFTWEEFLLNSYNTNIFSDDEYIAPVNEWYVTEIREFNGEFIVDAYFKDTEGNKRVFTFKTNRNLFKVVKDENFQEVNISIPETPATPVTPTQVTSPVTPKPKSAEHQSMLDNNATPAVKEVNWDGTKQRSTDRLSQSSYQTVYRILEENGAFSYVSQGFLQKGDEIIYIVTQETLDDGGTATIIWEAVKSKKEQLPTDSKFRGYQVINILDQTNADGARAELISRILEGYNKQSSETGTIDSFVYDKEPAKIDTITKGVVPMEEMGQAKSNSQETISTKNSNKLLARNSEGHYGFVFKYGSSRFVRLFLHQTTTNRNTGVTSSKDTKETRTPIEVIHKTPQGNETNDVVVVMPTPTGWQAVHPLYVLRRTTEGASEVYKKAVTKGAIGKKLKEKIANRISDNNFKTFFSDYFRFNSNISELIRYYPNNSRLELGYKEGTSYNVFTVAIKMGDNKWKIVNPSDARITLDDNNGNGFTLDEVSERYLQQLVTDENVGADMFINMNAIKGNADILDDLIEDGVTWMPNALSGRLAMENVGFKAPLGSQKSSVSTSTREVPKASPEPEKQPSQASTVEKKPKVTNNTGRIRKRFLGSESETTPDNAPKVPQSTAQQATPTEIISEEERLSMMYFQELPESIKSKVKEKLGDTAEKDWNGVNAEERQNVLKCL